MNLVFELLQPVEDGLLLYAAGVKEIFDVIIN